MRKQFKLWHSVVGIIALLCVETLLVSVLFHSEVGVFLILLTALCGGAWIVVLSERVVREVKHAMHMLVLLSGTMAEFIVFFACQYALMLAVAPTSYPELPYTPFGLLLHSTMIFVFNPLYLPATEWGRALLLVNTLGALVLVLFILQNIWQFRAKEHQL